jgi:uncharacterized protein YlxW (UPF0749 family)
MPEEEAETSGRDRLIQALRTPYSRSQLIAAVLLGALGFAAVVQVRANDHDDRFVGTTQQDLIQLINSAQLATDRVQRQISDLRATRDALKSDTAASQTALQVAKRQVESLGILTGTVPAVGPGVQVTIDGPPGSIGAQQLLGGVQELRDAGAEAIEVNHKVRLVAQSSFSQGSGDSVIVDGAELQPPYVVSAIGRPGDMDTALRIPQGFVDDVHLAGGSVTITQQSRIEIQSTRKLPNEDFATPGN